MSTISVDLPTQPYQIELAALVQAGGLVRPLIIGQKLLVVSNAQIFRHYGTALVAALEGVGYSVGVCLIPAGERYKTLATLQKIHHHCHKYQLDRRCGLVALGGGIVGDLTGFAAATWLRGIAVVQIPTSLLAMVDASIGGKTGVNTAQGKNLVGAFHQPKLVLIDPSVLQTLPPREWRSGLAEVIKYGVITDPGLFQRLEETAQLKHQVRVPAATLHEVLLRSAQAKAHIVQRDEREGGLRALLNYGHTVGHALETITQYRQYTHGEAVGLGMMAAGQLAAYLGYWTKEEALRQDRLIIQAGLPTQFPQVDPLRVLALMQGDKKVQDGTIRFVLPAQIGRAELVSTVRQEDILTTLKSLLS